MKFEIMDFKEELSDGEYEQTTADVTPLLKTTKRQHFSVLVLSEMEESERLGRVCRALKYRPKLIHRSNDLDLNDKKVFNLTADLIIKEPREVSDKKHVCKICGAEHASRAELKLHTEDHKLCRTGYRFRSGLAENEKNQCCVRETQTSSDEPDLNPMSSQPANHETQFPQSTKYVCNLCGIEYARKSNLISHTRIHTGETPYTCKICRKGFRRSDWLALHMNMHKDKSQASPDCRKKQFACDQCEKTYRRNESLQNHLRKHTGERPFRCAICEKRFYNGNCLKKHLTCHSDDRPFTCPDCGHGFKRLGTLRKHRRIHTGETPFSCSSCGKTFRYRYSMSLHKKNCS